jgi:hypothetical protein
MDMCSLLMSLKAIERVCTQKKSNAQCKKKAYNKGKKGNKQPSTEPMVRVSKKMGTKKNCNLCKKHGGAYTMHNTRECRKYEKDGSEKADFRAAKKGRQKSNLAKNSFVQMSEKLEKLEKAIMK